MSKNLILIFTFLFPLITLSLPHFYADNTCSGTIVADLQVDNCVNTVWESYRFSFFEMEITFYSSKDCLGSVDTYRLKSSGCHSVPKTRPVYYSFDSDDSTSKSDGNSAGSADVMLIPIFISCLVIIGIFYSLPKLSEKEY